jgi:hypothetical protein
MADERVEAAAKEIYKEHVGDDQPWDDASVPTKDWYRGFASRVIDAADAVEGEMVVWANAEKHRESFVRCYVGAEVEFSVAPGEELVVRKRRVV